MPTGGDPIADAHEFCRLDAGSLAEAYRTGKLSPVDVTQAVLARAEQINPRFNAFSMIDHDGALEAARRSEARWRAREPLSAVDGVPTTLKDIVWVRGWSVRYGSATTDPKPFETDAPAVARLRNAGAVFIGQTTTPEFGWKAVTDSLLSGVTRNPWREDVTPGGSSGGAAVAAACGAGVFHLGSDGGGSIRIPASFTGIVGLKPTFGRVPAHPVSVFGTVAHLGPMARNVADAAAMLEAMAGRSLRDWTQGAGVLPPLGEAGDCLAGARVGYWSRPAFGEVDPEVAQIVAASLPAFAMLGAQTLPFELPGDDLLDLFQRHWFAGAAGRLAQIPAERQVETDPGFREIAAEGAAMGVTALVAAHDRRNAFGADMDRLLDQHDFLVSPAVAVPPFEAGKEVPPGSGMKRWIEWAGFSYPINLSQQPACVIPCGMTRSGLPVGLQIIGARGADAKVLAAAASIEQALARSSPKLNEMQVA